MIGRLATGRSGLGMLEVMGRRRVPSPPAITTAFMSEASSSKRRRSSRLHPSRLSRTFPPWAIQALRPQQSASSIGHGVRADEAADLYHVEDSCPPVEGCTPSSERPSENSSE